MKNILLFILAIPFWVKGQEDHNGIKWTTGLSWDQVKEKAKSEKKFIFVDAYATWCKPCKMMDREVFPVDSVGEFYNANFICVKFQMDETGKDNDQIRMRRADANYIKEKFEVDAYPSYLYFNSSGEMVAKVLGFQKADKFIKKGRDAIVPGLVYHHPLERYRRLISEYKQGVKQYDSMYYMWSVANKIKSESKEAELLLDDINKHLESLPAEQLYTKTRLQFMESITTRPGSKWFHIFYRNAPKVNKVMEDQNYSERLIEKVLLESVAFPYINWKQPRGGMVTSKRGLVKEDKDEADWKGMERKLRLDFNNYYAKRVSLAARFIWYKHHQNYSSFTQSYLDYLDRYGLNSHSWTSRFQINDLLWYNAYLPINNKSSLKRAAAFLSEYIKQSKIVSISMRDTYARLLYKSGNTTKAIKCWEDWQLSDRPEADYADVLAKMKKGEKLDWWED